MIFSKELSEFFKDGENFSCHICKFRYDIGLNINGSTYRIVGKEWVHSIIIWNQITPDLGIYHRNN